MKSRPVLGAALLVAGTILLVALPFPADAQVLQRHVAEFRFGGEQIATNTAAAFPGPPDGNLIYFKTFPLPATAATVFVTLSTTGDAHEGVAHWFSARINGVPCSRGNEGAGFAPAGWIPLQKHFDYDPPVTYTSNGVGGQTTGDGGGGTGDMHDNGIYYTWCCLEEVRPGALNRVDIKMATSLAGTPVFVERSHYYVDSVDTKLCNQAAAIPVVVDPVDPVEIEETEANKSGQ
jgi:hypothetical protein